MVPSHEADIQQRLGQVKPVVVHLVTEGVAFEQIIARWDGHSWWFEELDRRSDPIVVDELKQALKQLISPETLAFNGLTPEMRTVYDLVTQQTTEFSQNYCDERRLSQALKQGGGELQQFQVRGIIGKFNG